ncbi:MAG TPA: magnesium/cobalt transporter CorA [Candidatus Marinimicrobia bacterium]|nr:magnesium/cobalt transporter CorA [Candidatus Neomarinimicrobiota bacterium]
MRKRKKKPGLPPGTLVYIGDNQDVKTSMTLFDYDAESLEEVTISEPAKLQSYLAENRVAWININGLTDVDTIRKIGEIFKIHSLVLEDIVNTDHRPKFEDYGKYYFSVVKMLTYDVKNAEINSEQVSFITGDNYLLTFQEIEGDVFETIREHLRRNKGRVRRAKADYLFYTLIDAIVDNYFNALEYVAEETEQLEELLLNDADTSVLQRIHRLKRELIFMRKSVWPLREVLNNIDRLEPDLFQDSTKLFFRDVYDHTIQIIDTIENLRDIVTGMLDIYLSTVSNRMNEVMKVLTMIATIFIPLTFIAGIYGMNFQYMPELNWKSGYPLVLGVMVLLGLGMVMFFRRKKWL